MGDKISAKAVLTNEGSLSTDNNSSSFENITIESHGGNCTVLDEYWTWKIDVVLTLIAIGVNIYFWIK